MFHFQRRRFDAQCGRVLNVDHIEPVVFRQGILPKAEARGAQEAHQNHGD